MLLIPRLKISYEVIDHSDIVAKKLSENIQPQKLLLFSYPDCSKKFVGSIKGNSFKMYRAIRYRNSFLPQIEGKFEQIGNSTQIMIKMSLHPVVAVFMTFWLGFFVVISGIMVIAWIAASDSFYVHPVKAISSSIGMFILGYNLMIIPFNIEAGKAKLELDKLFS